MIKIHEIKSVTHLALPLIAAFLAQKGMQFIDTLMMGWIGPNALAAGALGTGVFITLLLFCMGTLSAVGIFVVRAKGAENHKDITSSMQHGMILSFILCIPCMILIWLAPSLLLLIGQNPIVVENTALFLHGLVWGFPGFLLFLVFREFIAAFSFTKIVMLVTLGSLPLTFSINYLLIYGKWGIPPLGISGLGFAGAAIMWFMFGCLTVYSKRNSLLKDYVTFHSFKFDSQKMLDIIYIGIPSGLLLVFESGAFLLASIMMGYFGIIALASFQIIMQCISIAYAIPFALSMTTALQVGQAAGAKDLTKVRRIAFLNFTISSMISLVIALFFICSPNSIINIYLHAQDKNYWDIYRLTSSFLMIAAIFLCFDSAQGVANGALRGLKDTLYPMVLSLSCYWLLGVSAAYFLAFHTRLGSVGIWYGLTLGFSTAAVVLIWRFFIKLKHENLSMVHLA